MLAAHLLGLGRRLKIALWVWFALTATAAVHFGWHYVLDDLAGIAMGAVTLGLARLLSGIDFGALPRGRVAAAVGDLPAWNVGPRHRGDVPVPASRTGTGRPLWLDE